MEWNCPGILERMLNSFVKLWQITTTFLQIIAKRNEQQREERYITFNIKTFYKSATRRERERKSHTEIKPRLKRDQRIFPKQTVNPAAIKGNENG